MTPTEYVKRELEAGRLTPRHIAKLTVFAQEHLGLKADGMPGPNTRHAIAGEMHGLRADFTEAILNVARNEIGNGETHGNNRGPDIDRYAASCGWGPGSEIFWCAAFIYFCYRAGVEHLGIPRLVDPSVGARRLVDHMLEAGGIELEHPEPGCVVLLERGSPGGSAHLRLVEAVADNGASYTSIEGNSGPKVRRDTYPSDEPERIGFYRFPVAP